MTDADAISGDGRVTEPALRPLRELYGAEIDAIVARYPLKRAALLPLLWLTQEHDGWISEARVVEIAGILDLDPTEVRGVGGFYHLFYFHPIGRHVIRVCDDVICALKGADRLLDHLVDELDVDVGETTEDREFTVERTGWCIAACDHAPAVLVDDVYFGPVDEAELSGMIRRLRDGWQPDVPEGVDVGVVKPEETDA
jgi:NADH-quinone oxidoreductase subunit E